MKRIHAVLLFSFLTLSIYSQKIVDFRSPMDIPLILSGNFGELRSDHFHSGIDIKTKGVIGQKVYAIESGYVSRIKVQPGGYGKALYINHPGGYTSVYGHLSQYNATIGKFIRDLQYKRESHSIDTYLKPGDLKIEKGELIALSGNTGSSAGPHLHFEIRTTKDQIPVNALLYNFPIIDNIPPVFRKVAVYPMGGKSQVNSTGNRLVLELIEERGTFRLAKKQALKVYGTLGFGVEIYDYLNNSRNRCGIYSLELLVDGKRYYYSEMDGVSFSESRFINAHIDYALKQEQNISIQRLYKLPYNNLGLYKFMENKGYLKILDTLTHEVKIISKDTYGNSSILALEIKGVGSAQQMTIQETFTGKTLPYNAQSSYADKDIQLSFPAYAFYENVQFSYARTNGRSDLQSDVYHIHTSSTPVHKPYKITITPDSIPKMLASRLCIVSVGEEELEFLGGELQDGKISANLRAFGKFALAVDTIAPTIEALNIHSEKDMSGLPGIRFKVEDNLSGITEYKGIIDNQWVLFEYDPKNDLLFYEFDAKVPISKKNHELEISLSDALGNKTEYQLVFQR